MDLTVGLHTVFVLFLTENVCFSMSLAAIWTTQSGWVCVGPDSKVVPRHVGQKKKQHLNYCFRSRASLMIPNKSSQKMICIIISYYTI